MIKQGLRYNKSKYIDSITKKFNSIGSIVMIPSGFHYDIRLELSKVVIFDILD